LTCLDRKKDIARYQGKIVVIDMYTGSVVGELNENAYIKVNKEKQYIIKEIKLTKKGRKAPKQKKIKWVQVY